jgi:uncharacterized repeat protein (TIGR02543 family)
LLLHSDNGRIAGTPTAVGNFSFTVKATNSAGSDTKLLSIKIDPAPQETHFPEYQLTLVADPPEGGTIEGENGKYVFEATIPIGASPEVGYHFDHWESSNGGKFGDDGKGAGSLSTWFYMPAHDTTVTAKFVSDAEETAIPSHILTLVAEQGGRITIGESGSYSSGEMVEIEAEANNGYVFAGWVSSAGGKFGEDNDEAGNAWTIFHMPGNDVTVTAKFTATGGYRPPVTPTVIPSVTTPTPPPPPPPPPDDDDPWIVVVVDEDGTPQGEWHWDPDDEVWVLEPYTPLAPPTGDPGTVLWTTLTLAAMCCAAVVLKRKKRKAQ